MHANARLSSHEVPEPLRKRDVAFGFLYSEIPNLPVLAWFSRSCREMNKARLRGFFWSEREDLNLRPLISQTVPGRFQLVSFCFKTLEKRAFFA